MKLNKEDILNDIYNKIFLRELDYSINIFLCGANPNDEHSLRNIIYKEIKDNSQYNVVFPEWLFSNLLVKREYNLLKLENELASNVDVIVLPLEGYGTMAELGAFASFDKLCSKIIVINRSEYKSRRSFITLGPIKLISAQDKKNIIYYDEDKLDDLKNRVLSRIKSLRSINSKYDIRNLFNLSRFILYIIAIFQPVSIAEIKALIEEAKKGISLHFLDPCLEILLEKQKIRRDIQEYKDYYSLSSSGHGYIYEDLLRRLHIIKIFSRTRTKVINTTHRKLNKLNLDEERKFLVV